MKFELLLQYMSPEVTQTVLIISHDTGAGTVPSDSTHCVILYSGSLFIALLCLVG